MEGRSIAPGSQPPKPLLGPVLRGMLIASVALAGVFAFVRFEFGNPVPPNPAWAPSEVEGMKLGSPQDDKGAPAAPAAPVGLKLTPAASTPPPQRRSKTIVNQASGVRAPAVRFSTPPETTASEPATPSPSIADGEPPQQQQARDVLDADPPPPGAAASGRRPEDDKPIHKRLFRAVGKIFKGKKSEPKLEPSAHNPQQQP